METKKEKVEENLTFNPNLGFWNNLQMGIADLKNNIKYNLVSPGYEVKIKSYFFLQLFDKVFDKHTNEESIELQKSLNEIILMTYRSNFYPIVDDTKFYTNDCGWGCVLRASQMLMATTMLKLYLKTQPLVNSQRVVNEVIMLFFDNRLPLEYVKDFPLFKKVYEQNTKTISTKLTKSDDLTKKTKEEKDLFSDAEIVNLKNTQFLNQFKPQEPITTFFSKSLYIPNPTQLSLFINDKQDNIHYKPQGDQTQVDLSFVFLDSLEVNKNIESIMAPFSIQNLCVLGMSPTYNKTVGEWYSDVLTMQLLKGLSDTYLPDNSLKIFHSQESVVYLDEFVPQHLEKTDCTCLKSRIEADGFEFVENIDERICSTINFDNKDILEPKCHCYDRCFNYKDAYYEVKTPGLILVSCRVGLEKIESQYHSSIYNVFDVKGNLGMVGGKSGRAFYFIGVWREKDKENRLLYLDPHLNQDALKSVIDLEKNADSYRPNNFYKISVSDISPSFTCAFFYTNTQEFILLMDSLSKLSQTSNPVLKISDAGLESRIKLNESLLGSFTDSTASFRGSIYQIGDKNVKIIKDHLV